MPLPELTSSLNKNTDSNLRENIKNPPPKMVPINTDKEDLENLKKILESNDITDKDKHLVLRRITGACVTCAGISEYYLIHDLDGCSKIERYCSPCIEKEKAKLILVESRRKR